MGQTANRQGYGAVVIPVYFHSKRGSADMHQTGKVGLVATRVKTMSRIGQIAPSRRNHRRW
ncbi:MAG: hypothetical protein JWQ42_1126 [Edaphobacter sp.]|nr:hypothetical protein [Edaphobacter sp.]